MDTMHQRLADLLYEKNGNLTIEEARTWVELLWEDFETTQAKAGREYHGKQMTEQIVLQWIEHYGPKLHDFVTANPKYKELLKKKGRIH